MDHAGGGPESDDGLVGRRQRLAHRKTDPFGLDDPVDGHPPSSHPTIQPPLEGVEFDRGTRDQRRLLQKIPLVVELHRVQKRRLPIRVSSQIVAAIIHQSHSAVAGNRVAGDVSDDAPGPLVAGVSPRC
jgi:hypothetical protein